MYVIYISWLIEFYVCVEEVLGGCEYNDGGYEVRIFVLSLY